MSETTNAAEFPKLLYMGGQAYARDGKGVPHQNTLLVNNAAEEEAARAEGFEAVVLPEAVTEPEPEIDTDTGELIGEDEHGNLVTETGLPIGPAQPGDADHAAADPEAPAEVEPVAEPATDAASV